MPMPEGARNVAYRMTQYGGGAEVNVLVQFELNISADLVDAAAAAAMEAFAAKLEELTPGVPAGASRAYDVSLPGDPWPPPAA
ncbi:hypothetical protein AB0903_08995 [Streptomyces sp. NPDC048389]|uniref:hypothetical protein n=1 Tax=Streptomyces sp. NPDC048389 TaxID=3154622 RepID=UPI003455E01F